MGNATPEANVMFMGRFRSPEEIDILRTNLERIAGTIATQAEQMPEITEEGEN
jgi:hypothetical protein